MPCHLPPASRLRFAPADRPVGDAPERSHSYLGAVVMRSLKRSARQRRDDQRPCHRLGLVDVGR